MRNKILTMLKNTDKYISGESMSAELGISRAAIWKHIKKLKEEGYNILSVTNKGYKLEGVPDNISVEEINSRLSTDFIARNIKYINSTDSTNNECKRLDDKVNGTLIISEIQTAGKGRLGRAWESPYGSGIWMSLLLKPDISIGCVSQITLVAGMAVCKALRNGSMIKWPNDVVVSSKKLCGILTEMSAEIERINYVICGIGINVNTEEFPEELQDKATSLLLETGERHNRAEIIADIMNEFEKLYKIFAEKGFGAIAAEYKEMCITLNRRVQVIYKNETVLGTAVDVDNSGNLIVETDSGRITVSSGEVSVRGIYGYI